MFIYAAVYNIHTMTKTICTNISTAIYIDTEVIGQFFLLTIYLKAHTLRLIH